MAGCLQVPWQGSKWEVVVAMGSLKGGRAETLVEKISELGAWSLQPLLTSRSPAIGGPAKAVLCQNTIHGLVIQTLRAMINFHRPPTRDQ